MDQTPPAPFERLVRAAAYAAIGISGVWLLFSPATSIGTALGHVLTIIWSCFLLVALPAAVATMLGRYRAEYAFLPWFTGALILSVCWEWFRVAHGFGNTPRAFLNAALTCLLVVRFISLHQLVKVRVRGRGAWKPGSK